MTLSIQNVAPSCPSTPPTCENKPGVLHTKIYRRFGKNMQDRDEKYKSNTHTPAVD